MGGIAQVAHRNARSHCGNEPCEAFAIAGRVLRSGRLVTPPVGRRYSDRALKGAAESDFRLVAHHLRDSDPLRSWPHELVCGQLHASMRQVLHRRMSHKLREALGQDRSRGPACAASAPSGQRECHHRIVEPGRPPLRRIRAGLELPAHDLDEHQLGQPQQHAAGALGVVAQLG